jgi:hypothetical protein
MVSGCYGNIVIILGNGSISFKEFLKGFPEEIFRPPEEKKGSVEKEKTRRPPGRLELPMLQEEPQQPSQPEPEKKQNALYPEPAFSPTISSSVSHEPIATGKLVIRPELYDLDLYKKVVLQYKGNYR